MKNLLLSLFVILLCHNSFAKQPDQPIPAFSIAKHPGVYRENEVAIFDGDSLDGWVKRDGTPSENWVVEGRTLHRSNRGGDLYLVQTLEDFELIFEWKIEEKGNSGVKYRVRDYGKQSLGCEYQLQDDGNQPFQKTSTGGLYAVYEPNQLKLSKPVGEWNHSKIVVYRNRIEHWLNGRKVVSAESGSEDWLERVASSKFKDRVGFGQNSQGKLFLQDHGNPVWFRNMNLVKLD